MSQGAAVSTRRGADMQTKTQGSHTTCGAGGALLQVGQENPRAPDQACAEGTACRCSGWRTASRRRLSGLCAAY